MNRLEDVIRRDTRAHQPLASAMPPGAIYCVEDEANIIERSNGIAWHPFGSGGGVAAAGTLSGTTLAANVVASSLTSVGVLAALTVTAPIVGSVTGAAATATLAAAAVQLATPRLINGVPFDGTADITIGGGGGGSTDASDLTSGTLADARLSANVPLIAAANSAAVAGARSLALRNTDTGSSSLASLELGNGGAADLLSVGVAAAAYANIFNPWRQGDGGWLLAKGGLSIGTIANATELRFYNGGSGVAAGFMFANGFTWGDSSPAGSGNLRVGGSVTALSGVATTAVLASGSVNAASYQVGGAALAESHLSLTDITTNDVSTTKHGLAPKLPNDATKYLDGTGAYTVPAGGGGGSNEWTVPATRTDTGAINNWAPGLSHNTLVRWNGAADGSVSGLAGGTTGQLVTIRNLTSTKVLYLLHQSGLSTAGNKLKTLATTLPTPVAAGGWATLAYDGADWQLIAHEQGAAVDVPFNAADFTVPSGTWTVTSGQVGYFYYWLRGRQLDARLQVLSTTLTGTPGHLRVQFPGAAVAGHNSNTPSSALSGGGFTVTIGGTPYFQLYLPGAVAYAAGSITYTGTCQCELN